MRLFLYTLSLCLYSLELRPKNSASFKSKNVNTIIYVDVVLSFFKMISNLTPNVDFLSRKLQATME